MKTRFLQLAGLFVALTACVLVGAGCGDKRSRVSGTIKYKGAIVPGGNIYLVSDNGSISSPIQMSGEYAMTDVPPGMYTVVIETETVNPDKKVTGMTAKNKTEAKMREGKAGKIDDKYADQMKGSSKSGDTGNTGGGSFAPASHDELLKHYIKIPDKYANKTTSGMTFEVTTGDMKKDYDLTD